MSLVLDQNEHRALETALEALLSPLDYRNVDDWRRAVNCPLRTVMRADAVSFLVPLNETTNAFSQELDCEASTYSALMRSEAAPAQLQRRLRDLMVADRPTGWGRHYRNLHRTAYWNEFAKPLGLFDSLTVVVPTGPEPKVEHSAQLIFNRCDPRTRAFGEREVAIGRLILPAFRAGVMTWLKLRTGRATSAVDVDHLETPIIILDCNGHELHRNPALDQLLDRDDERVDIVGQASRMAASLARSKRNARTPLFETLQAESFLRTARCEYLLRASRIEAAASHCSPAIVVTVRTGTLPVPSVDALRRQFGLTAQQAVVALLLAERKTGPEIADRLCVSQHTARRHTEAVLEKLEIHSRLDVRSRITEGNRTP